MKKHKSIDNEEMVKRICDEVNETSNIRYLSLSIHLYIEYYLNELIRLKFDDAKFIIDGNELGSFYNKCQILRALGVFKQKDLLMRNIKLLNNIRNFYAHNLPISNKLSEEVKSRIKQLIYFDVQANKTDHLRWEDSVDEYLTQFKACGFMTISVLQCMVWELEAIETSI